MAVDRDKDLEQLVNAMYYNKLEPLFYVLTFNFTQL